MIDETQKSQMLERLSNLALENGEITKIEFQDEMEEPNFGGLKFLPVPARCEVWFVLRPTDKSEITTAISLPIDSWNGRFLGTGNGGSAGEVGYNAIIGGAARGFATANTDLGSSKDPSVMHNNVERWIDFGHRATHLSTVASKQIIEAFYGKKPEYSYFIGSSTGGQQGVMESQRYPEDYDGIISFSPACNRVNLHNTFIHYFQALKCDPECAFTVEKINAIRDRVIELFVEKSGGAKGDNFLSYAGKVNFKPDDVYEVFDGLGLNAKQLNALKDIYSMPISPLTGKEIFPPQPLGCETGLLMTVTLFGEVYESLNFPAQWVFGKDFDAYKYDFNADYLRLREKLSEICDATNPDLSDYKAHGGKFILITGSDDNLITYMDGKNYYESVIDRMGGLEKTTDFFRYFHVPGLGHGFGGRGLQEIGSLIALKSMRYEREYDALASLIAWVEEGVTPDVLYPAAFVDGKLSNDVDYVRPVYPYPYETEYIGGDRKKKESFRKKLGNGVY